MIQIRVDGKTGESTTLDAPLEHLMACHRRIEERLSTLERAGKVLDSQRGEALNAIRAAFAFMDSNGAIHTRDEEESLFPRLASRITATEAELVATLEAEHEEAERIYQRLREIVDQVESGDEAAVSRYSDEAAALCRLYRAHIAAEDSRLMETARRGLTDEDLAAISQEMKNRRGLI